tara:strand:- start:817 stop:1053 length:237 start_codon:yes stop_codon:yes gene_type:complete
MMALLRIPDGRPTSGCFEGLLLVWIFFEELCAYRLMISWASRPNGKACAGSFFAENEIVKVRQKIVMRRLNNIAQSSL